MKKKQIEIVTKLRQAQTILHHALIDVKAENIEGQFDYCNSPDLSDSINSILSFAKKIDDVVYQRRVKC